MAVALPVILGVQFLLQAIVLDVSLVPRTPISPPRLSEKGLGESTGSPVTLMVWSS